MATGFPSQKNVPHLIPGWLRVIKDVEPTKLDLTKLRFVGFLLDKERSINIEEVQKRAVELMANCGLSDVPAILGEQKGLTTIPDELRQKIYIIIPGTVLEDSGGRQWIPCLGWSADQCWALYFSPASIDPGESGRLASYG